MLGEGIFPRRIRPAERPFPRPAAALPTDEQLASGVQRGRAADLTALVERHHGPLLGFLYRLTAGDRALAEDLTQEAFLRALRRIAQYRPARPFKPWLYAIAVNAARDHFKRADTRRTEALTDEFDPPDPGAVDEGLLAAEDAGRVARALGALPAPQRETLVLRYYQDLSLAEVAEVLEIPLGTVKSRLSVGLDRLKRLLEDEA